LKVVSVGCARAYPENDWEKPDSGEARASDADRNSKKNEVVLPNDWYKR